MTEDDIIKMAKAAHISVRGHYDEVGSTPSELMRFAALVAAHEREACAKVCDEQASRSETSMLKAKSVKTRDIYSAAGQTAHWMAQVIRARSQQ